MTGPSAIIELFTQVRSYTLGHLTRESKEALLWTPPHLQNHILWRSGHALWAVDLLAVVPLVGESELPEGWDAIFAEGTSPRDVQQWPDRATVVAQLERQRERLVNLLRELQPSLLEGPALNLNDSRNLGGWIIHAIHDEAVHQGESFLTLKMIAAAARETQVE